jgi:hypothetical protein
MRASILCDFLVCRLTYFRNYYVWKTIFAIIVCPIFAYHIIRVNYYILTTKIK